MTLDETAAMGLSRPDNDIGARFDPPRMSCGSRRWHCAWTHPREESRSLTELGQQGWEAFLPLHIDAQRRIGPLWPRYILVRFDPNADPWGAIRGTRGIGGLIQHAPGRPTSLPSGVVGDLIARTSERGVVDDPGDAGLQRPVQAGRGVWRNIGALSEAERVAMLQRLFTLVA